MDADEHKSPPSAPPLPPAPHTIIAKSEQAVETPSAYHHSLKSMPADGKPSRSIGKALMEEPYKPKYYFFYGTLTQPDILKHILDLQEEPVLRPAKITGYALTDWGQYRMLVDGRPGQEVTGHAYVVQLLEDERKLARYEPSAYEVAPCQMQFAEGRDPAHGDGMTFKYAGDDEALMAGRFDQKLWELQMGTRLPEKWRTRYMSSSGQGET
ncbi:hypothetical protein N8I77_007290 [Diaporthe amygdali]|uniref:Putative gamma-glutamylcyclotransferase n=1 Tax=Phomopsis amygdali TaxID=1214568 RepID=A0AAD9SBD2_PHOAM|nr:hypothetical protein N8I77_007290 [Diaporthe amygdali]